MVEHSPKILAREEKATREFMFPTSTVYLFCLALSEQPQRALRFLVAVVVVLFLNNTAACFVDTVQWYCDDPLACLRRRVLRSSVSLEAHTHIRSWREVHNSAGGCNTLSAARIIGSQGSDQRKRFSENNNNRYSVFVYSSNATVDQAGTIQFSPLNDWFVGET